jgi:endonuclease-8
VLERAVPVGKHLFLRFDDDLSLHCHLRLDGSWRVFSRRPPINHRVRAVLATRDTWALGILLHDMALLSTSDEHKLVDHLGPDLLDPDWSDESLAEAARRLAAQPDRELGQALLDQTVMAGIGNVYKSELCFLLGVTPWSPVSAVNPATTVKLARKLLRINALRTKRNTTGNLRRGRELWVYHQERVGCQRCGGPVRVAYQGDDSRITFYCPHCQPGPTGA